jgi:hypothetical protein
MEQMNHLNNSMESLANKKLELVKRREEMQNAIMEILIKRNLMEDPEQKEKLKKEHEDALNDYDTKRGRDLEEEIFQLNKEIMLRGRKDLANNFLVTQMVMNDLYNNLLELPENDPRIDAIENKILELEGLLSRDKEAMNREGLSEKRVKGGGY